jgi:GTPase
VYEVQRADGVASEKAILVRVILDGQTAGDDPLDELNGLAKTAGTRIVSGLTQRREVPDVATYLGKGKVKELKALVEHHDADVVIFDNDLHPGQTRNLEQTLGIKVIDRTELILDIFASNAQTYESRLAVELAQLEYSLPRLKRMWTHLSRIKAGIGMRGPGEKQLEEDRRLVEKRIHDLRTELHGVERRKERLVASRTDRLTVSLVGYTNAGKSTLMNALTGAGVLAEDKLFATLDPTTRRLRFPREREIIIADTVGFIRELPKDLAQAFRATLEELAEADLLLHVVDAADPDHEEHMAAVERILGDLDLAETPRLVVYNKVDLLPAEERHRLAMDPRIVTISAREAMTTRPLLATIEDRLWREGRIQSDERQLTA